MSRAAELRFFDCNAVIGKSAVPVLGSWLSGEAMLREMDSRDIAEALVSHAHAREIGPAVGNPKLLTEVAATNGRLHPLWTIFPEHGRISPPVNQEIEAMLGAGSRAAIVHPNPTLVIMDESIHARHFPVHPSVTGELFEALQARRVPLFIDIGQVRWEEVYDTCARYPDLPLVILNAHYTHKRSLFAGLKRFPNLHFEISGWHVHQGLEELVGLFGSPQVLFGTRLPVYEAASAMAIVLYAAIDDEAKLAIAGGNLRRLLGGVITEKGLR